MSTLTSSPSPVSSPRSSFHSQHQRRSSTTTEHLSRLSPHLTYAASNSPPRRPFHAPLPSASSSPSTSTTAFALVSGSRKPRPEPSESLFSNEGRVRYVHAGTQYSPDGYPPTAGRKLAPTAVEQPPGSPGSVGKKRKERERESDPRLPMTAEDGDTDPSGPSAAAAATAEATATGTTGSDAPRESQLRTAPDPSQNQPAPPIASTSASATQSSQNPEPQEARSTHGHSSAPKRSRVDPGNVHIMPREYWTSNPKDLGVLISSMLMELIRLNDQIPLRDGRLTRFHSRAPPGISVSDYLQRLIHHATLSPPILLSMVRYIDRLCQLYPAFTINSLTVHRFLITAATVAAKGLSDSFWTNPTYARIGGIPVSELATLELEFLQKVQWKIVPKPEVLEEYYRSLVERTEGYELEREGGPLTSSGSESENLGETEGGDEDEDDEEEDEHMTDEPT